MGNPIILLLSFVSATAQQNLIPNPSFEEYWSCPIENELGQGEFMKCKHWWYPHPAHIGTPDYFNRCNNSIVSVPSNFWGYQEAYHGDAYVGILPIEVSINDGNIVSREMISTKLIRTLSACGIYKFHAYINLANKSSHSIRDLGVFLSSDSLDLSSFMASTSIELNWESYMPIRDTSSWVEISGEVTSVGGEQYLTIGYFKNYILSEWTFNDSIIISSGFLAPYYYIDSLSLVEQFYDFDCDVPLPNVITPNGDGSNEFISISELGIETLTIYNRWGSCIAVLNEDNAIWYGNNLKGKKCAEGVFYYIGNYGTKTIKGTIQLIR